MDTSTSDSGNVLTTLGFIRADGAISHESIKAAEWAELLDDLFGIIRPQAKYISGLKPLEGKFDFASTVAGEPFTFGLSSEWRTKIFAKWNRKMRVRAISPLPPASKVERDEEYMDTLFVTDAGELLRLSAKYRLVGKVYLSNDAKVSAVKFADLPLTNLYFDPVTFVGLKLLRRLTELAEQIVTGRDEHTDPFRKMAAKGRSYLGRIS